MLPNYDKGKLGDDWGCGVEGFDFRVVVTSLKRGLVLRSLGHARYGCMWRIGYGIHLCGGPFVSEDPIVQDSCPKRARSWGSLRRSLAFMVPAWQERCCLTKTRTRRQQRDDSFRKLVYKIHGYLIPEHGIQSPQRLNPES